MHQQTGEIKEFDKMTEAEKKDKKWIPLTADEHVKAQGMNRAQRRRYARELRRQMANLSKGQNTKTPADAATPEQPTTRTDTEPCGSP